MTPKLFVPTSSRSDPPHFHLCAIIISMRAAYDTATVLGDFEVNSGHVALSYRAIRHRVGYVFAGPYVRAEPT